MKKTPSLNLMDCVIRSFLDSANYEEANELAKLLKELEKIKPFTEEQVITIVEAFAANDQVRSAWTAGPFVKQIFSEKYLYLFDVETYSFEALRKRLGIV